MVSYFSTGSRTPARSMRHPWGTKTPTFSCRAATPLIVVIPERPPDEGRGEPRSRAAALPAVGRATRRLVPTGADPQAPAARQRGGPDAGGSEGGARRGTG